MTPDLTTQIRNVITGRTAFGGAGHGPMGFPNDPTAFTVLFHWTDRFLAECSARDDRTRTVFIRKLANFLTRHGYLDDDGTPFVDGTAWFSENPDDLFTRMSFNAAARRRQQQQQAYSADQRHIERELIRSAMAVPEPPFPVLLSDGPYQLVQLVHPMHLLRVGLSTGNCLSQCRGNEDLPNARYWMRVAHGTIKLFAITHDTRTCAILSLAGSAVRECEYVRPPADMLAFVVKAFAALERRYGPLQDDLNYVMIDGEMIDAPRSETTHDGL